MLERHVHNFFYNYLIHYELFLWQFLLAIWFQERQFMLYLPSLTGINDWHYYINNDNIVGCITFDFRKAFDVVCHENLIKKLSLYGCDHLTLSWFSSFLSDRSQYVHFDNAASDIDVLSHGVPQGSILGPLLFTVFK